MGVEASSFKCSLLGMCQFDRRLRLPGAQQHKRFLVTLNTCSSHVWVHGERSELRCGVKRLTRRPHRGLRAVRPGTVTNPFNTRV